VPKRRKILAIYVGPITTTRWRAPLGGAPTHAGHAARLYSLMIGRIGSERIGELAARCDRALTSFIQAQTTELLAARPPFR